jgi:hypothetical protein
VNLPVDQYCTPRVTVVVVVLKETTDHQKMKAVERNNNGKQQLVSTPRGECSPTVEPTLQVDLWHPAQRGEDSMTVSLGTAPTKLLTFPRETINGMMT